LILIQNLICDREDTPVHLYSQGIYSSFSEEY